mmetsp:Transcript_28845/g.83696  ORF Transcript_28845/g.83696 Transcript_28845/m.83696 type:complete len:276 (+) Transcript_28845:2-829(+)
MVPIIPTAFVVSSALFTGGRCATGQGEPRRRKTCIYRRQDQISRRMVAGDVDDEADAPRHPHEEQDTARTATAKKPQSRLAMAAADWLEEEEDELSQYWDRFDAAKAASKGGDVRVTQTAGRAADQTTALPTSSDANTSTNNNVALSTEELLERYHESRGINKEEERKHGRQIEDAVRAAGRASSAKEAIRILDAVRPYLQYNTKLGGTAFLELAQAMEADGDCHAATKVYRELATSPHADIRRQSRELLAQGTDRRPKRQYKRGIWDMLWDGWD